MGSRFRTQKTIILFAVMVAIVTNCSEGFTRCSPIAHAQAEERQIATALETYYIDNNCYPPGKPFVGNVSDLYQLTTPVAHLSSIPVEPDYGLYRIGGGVVGFLLLFVFLVYPLSYIFWLIKFRKTITVLEFLLGSFFWITFFFIQLSLIPLDSHRSLPFNPLIPVLIFLLVFGGWFVRRSLNEKIFKFKEEAYFFGFPLYVFMLVMLLVIQIDSLESFFYKDKEPNSYQYATDSKNCWIIISSGMDEDYDPDLSSYVEGPKACDLNFWMKNYPEFTYDPTNGTTSSGDVWRTGP